MTHGTRHVKRQRRVYSRVISTHDGPWHVYAACITYNYTRDVTYIVSFKTINASPRPPSERFEAHINMVSSILEKGFDDWRAWDITWDDHESTDVDVDDLCEEAFGLVAVHRFFKT